VDVLSQVLKIVRLDGALFINAELSSPWSFLEPASCHIARFLAPNAEHLIIYHFVTNGRAWASLENGPRVDLGPGDIVLFPHGDAHRMGNGSPVEPVNTGLNFEKLLANGLAPVQFGGGGEVTKIVCGYMACEPQLSRTLLDSLPPMLTINIRDDAAGAWLENSIRFSVDHAASAGAGGEAVLSKLSEVLFIETLRRYVASLSYEETGWLAGVRDAEVGKALGMLHREPARRWTIADLAAEVGVSRAVLAERFRHYLGDSPIAYLTAWRLRLASRMLVTTNESVAEIAVGAGYDSEAAFNRAFKRQFGIPPARYRKHGRSEAAAATALEPVTVQNMRNEAKIRVLP
jgi:AraC-like DNA-binding protein